MTEPEQDDLTADDRRVELTDNGLRPDDPPEGEQPPQDPAYLPPGTESEREEQQ
jgi:hypothetical protein